MSIEAIQIMKQALEALETVQGYIEAELNDRKSLYEPYGMDYKYKTEADDLAETKEAITSLRTAIATAVAEPHKESSNAANAAATQEPKKCGLCGEDKAFTGNCGGGRDKPNALCYESQNHPQTKAEQEPKRAVSETHKWVGLTDVEWMNIVNKNQAWFGMQPDEVAHEVCKLTEAKLKEKNT